MWRVYIPSAKLKSPLVSDRLWWVLFNSGCHFTGQSYSSDRKDIHLAMDFWGQLSAAYSGERFSACMRTSWPSIESTRSQTERCIAFGTVAWPRYNSPSVGYFRSPVDGRGYHVTVLPRYCVSFTLQMKIRTRTNKLWSLIQHTPSSDGKQLP